MYLIKSGEHRWFADSVVLIRLSDNGSYVPCEDRPQGFCAKLADFMVDAESGEEVATLFDRVFVFDGEIMHGDEPVGGYEEVGGAVPLTEDELMLAIITGEVEA